PSVLAADREPTLFQDADGGDIVFRNMGIQRPLLDKVEKRCERLGRNALAPVLLANPVADEWLTGLLPFPDVPSNMPLEEDGLLYGSRVTQESGPVRHERIPVPGRERRHLVGLRVQLLLEEDGEVTLGHVPQTDIAALRVWRALDIGWDVGAVLGHSHHSRRHVRKVDPSVTTDRETCAVASSGGFALRGGASTRGGKGWETFARSVIAGGRRRRSRPTARI